MGKLNLIFLIVVYSFSCRYSDQPGQKAVTLTNQEELPVLKKYKEDNPSTPYIEQAKKFTQRTVLSGKLEMLIPASFNLMDDDMLAVKYPMEGRRPSEVYTNEAGSVNVALNHTQNRHKASELHQNKQVLQKQFGHPTIKFIASNIRSINGQECIIMEFVSPAVDTRVYNLMYVTSLDDRLMIGTFNCTELLRSEWEPIGKEIINSIKLN